VPKLNSLDSCTGISGVLMRYWQPTHSAWLLCGDTIGSKGFTIRVGKKRGNGIVSKHDPVSVLTNRTQCRY